MLGIIDRLARKWLDWRVDRELRRDPAMAGCELNTLSYRDGRVDMGFTAPSLAIMAEECAAVLMSFKADNYVEFRMVSKKIMPYQVFVVTVRRMDGETPATRAARFEDELKRIKAAMTEGKQ